jgi:peptidoglycan/LPS O-acetylase OafA/YrhL
LQNFQFAWQGAFDGSNGHLWSLVVEEQFYLFWPLIVLLVPQRFLLKTIIAMIMLGPLTRLVGWEILLAWDKNPDMINVLTPTTLDCFGLGGLLAYMETFHLKSYLKFVRSSKPVWIAFFGVLVHFLLEQGEMYDGILDNLFGRTAISLWCVYIIPMHHRFNVNFVKSIPLYKLFIHIGKVSYGIYLFHPYIKLLFDNLRNFLMASVNSTPLAKAVSLTYNHNIEFVILTVVTITTASLSWWSIESPINRLKKYVPYS